MIRVNDLDYSYSQQDHALKGISFEVKDQEWLSILGHNGSGKSTISKLLVGILAPQRVVFIMMILNLPKNSW